MRNNGNNPKITGNNLRINGNQIKIIGKEKRINGNKMEFKMESPNMVTSVV